MSNPMPYRSGYNSVRRKPSGKYEARWSDESGKVRGKSFLTEEQAKRYSFARAKEVLDGATGLGVPSKDIRAAAAEFLGQYLDPGTVGIYERHINKFIADNPTALRTGQITKDLIAAYDVVLGKRGHNPGGRRHILKTIKTFTEFCLDHKWIYEDPFRKFKLPKQEFEGRALTPAETERLIAGDRETDYWIRCAVRLARSTMRRSSQIWALTPDNFREPGLLYFLAIKKQEAVWLPLQPEAIAILRELLARPDRPTADARLFFHWCSVEHLRDAIREKAIAVGLKGTRLHDAGKVTRVTELDEAGKGLGYISAVSGTSQAVLSRHYIKPDRRRALRDYTQTYGRPTESLKPTETSNLEPIAAPKSKTEFA